MKFLYLQVLYLLKKVIMTKNDQNPLGTKHEVFCHKIRSLHNALISKAKLKILCSYTKQSLGINAPNAPPTKQVPGWVRLHTGKNRISSINQPIQTNIFHFLT